MTIEFLENLAASATETDAGTLVLVSRVTGNKIQLLVAKFVEFKGKPQVYLRNELTEKRYETSLDVTKLRSSLSSELGSVLTEHLFRTLENQTSLLSNKDVIENTVWYYLSLSNWGEASAAREIALRWRISVRTIQNRIRIARDRGMLKSPGQGTRIIK
jgi:hypothetical protein